MIASISPFDYSVVFTGYITSLSLILAIGAQNAFILRQGIRRAHVLPLILACAGSDAILITLGVFGFEQIERILPEILPIAKYGGSAFLLAYGAMAFRAAWRGGEALDPSGAAKQTLSNALIACLMITWLNPHVYLDTVVLLGSLSAQYEGGRYGFALGATLASFSFFFALGYGAQYLAPIFAQPKAWRILDVLVGLMMWSIALSLLIGV
ncbi:LysE/ArgO family amino acid transporter [Falsihalocynthiibacter arcticus]|uniref:Amino acid transporter n=1 Tax=Falsihalocynthiibacter arcticus TaxID=1579316 RepID=A0A126UVC3_9RHOB|nr:LysE/ArgO family amino acid transporter [Falsihalocynthiibacter arcticus]AML50008.1 amino acid transporter [Falsihalocynthiibacter arcticus]